MKERNVNGGQGRKREDQRCSIWGRSAQTSYRHSGSQPFNPPSLYSFELFRAFGWFFDGSSMIKGNVSVVNSVAAWGT